MAFILDLKNAVKPLHLGDEIFAKFNALEDVGEVPDDYAEKFSDYFDDLDGGKARAEFLIRIYGADDPDKAIREFFDKRR